jgi:thiol-disulfide isomerase/thioredoxin
MKLIRYLLLALLFPTAIFAADTPTASALPKGILQLSPYAAPGIKLQDMDGEPYTLTKDRGHWVFVHFWASWCGPCRKEMPAIQRVFDTLEPAGLKLALINTAEDEDTIFIFLSALAPELRPLMDRDGQTTERWQPRGLPATYLVDPQGKVRYQALGGRPWDTESYVRFLRTLVKPFPN